MKYTLKIENMTIEFDNFDDFVAALAEEAEDRELNRKIDLHIEVLNP